MFYFTCNHGLTVVRPSLQSAPEPPALDPCARYAAISWGFRRPVTSTFQLKIGTPLTRALGERLYQFCFFSTFLFRVTRPYGADGQRDRRTRSYYSFFTFPMQNRHSTAIEFPTAVSCTALLLCVRVCYRVILPVMCTWAIQFCYDCRPV